MKTHARQWVIFLAVALSAVSNLDRACISQASGNIQTDLGLDKGQMSLIFSAFLLTYGLFEIPSGWLGDKIGPRKVLTRVVLMWSAFTAASGAAWNFGSLLIFRFIFGAGESGCYPNLTKIFTIWLPSRERVRAQGLMWLSGRWGAAFAPLLVAFMMHWMSWRWVFAIFGMIGAIWAAWFYFWFRDNPREHPGVSNDELALLDGAETNLASHAHVPWSKILASPTVWLLCLQYFCVSYCWYFNVTWLPTYLREARQVSLDQGAFLAGLPLFFGGLGNLVAGLLARPAAGWFGGTARARRAVACFGLCVAATMLVVSTKIQSPLLAMVALGAASFANDLAMPSSWGACMDVGGKYSASLSASMNMMGQFGGAVGPIAVAQILKHTHNNWAVTFWAGAGMYLIGALSWLFIDPVSPIDQTGALPGLEPSVKRT